MSDIIIRDLTTFEECERVREIQRQCWGFSQEDMGLYSPLLLTVSENGGTVLGAFDGDKMVGYLFGYPALHDPQGRRILKIYSQTMGVLPQYRNRGIAEQLKWAQRDRALALGIELITWTFDPLEGANAHLNLHKLGGIVRTYKRNVYGEHFGQLNEGQPTDRFLVEWWVGKMRDEGGSRKSEGGGRKAEGGRRKAEGGGRKAEGGRRKAEGGRRKAEWVTRVEGEGAAQRLIEFDLECRAEAIAVEIPENIQAIRRADLTLAREWRMQTRQIFETYFARGYTAVDFISQQRETGRRNWYVLVTG